MKKTLHKKWLLVLLFTSSILYSQIPEFISAQKYSAVGSGTTGIPSVTFDIPSGENRFMVINIFIERYHATGGSNHPVNPSGTQYPLTTQINGNSYDFFGNGTGRGPTFSDISGRRWGFNQFISIINLETHSVPMGSTTISFPNLNTPNADSDEISVIVSVYKNVKSTRANTNSLALLTNTNKTEFGPFTGLLPTVMPIGRTLSDILFVGAAGLTQATNLTMSAGWNSPVTMRNVVPNTVGWPTPDSDNGILTDTNTPIGISVVSGYRNFASGPPEFSFTRANTGELEAGLTSFLSLIPFASPEVSGMVVQDIDGATNINGTGTNAGGLYVNAINAAGNLVYSATVSGTGTFTIPSGYLNEGSTYDFQLSKNTGTIGQPAPVKEIPTGWTTVGESTSALGNDGTADGNIHFTMGTTNISGWHYGINTSTSGTPIPCNNAKTYVVMQHTTGISGVTSLYTIDMITGATNLIKNPILPASEGSYRRINCIGYNVVDGFLYGYRSQTNQIVKIDALGNYELLTIPGLVVADVSTATAGDIYNNELYLFDNQQRKLWKINLSTLAVTIINFTMPNNNDIFFISLNDFSFGTDGNIYGILTDKRLFKINLTTNTFSYIGNASGSQITSETGSWGTSFIDAAGNLYVGNNTSRNTYKFEYNALTNTYDTNAIFFTQAKATGQVLADGASCPFVLPPKTFNDSVCLMTPPVASQSITTNVLANDVEGTYDINVTSVKLINPITSAQVTSVTIAGQGTFSVNTTGQITFTSISGFSGTSIRYLVQDINGNTSNESTLYINNCIDSDGDGILDIDDVDDDNDGILDINECSIDLVSVYVPNNFTSVSSSVPGSTSDNTKFLTIRPSDFGFTTAGATNVSGTHDYSSFYGLPTGSVIVEVQHANVHPSSDNFYTTALTNNTTIKFSGTVGQFVTFNHGAEYFGTQERGFEFVGQTMNGITPYNVQATGGNWESGNTGNYYYVRHTAISTENAPLFIANANSQVMSKEVIVSTNNTEPTEFSTYFISIFPECDTDKDGIPNRLDLDSDADGCPDAIEGGAGITNTQLVNAGGIVSGGSTAVNQNLCANASCVSPSGVNIGLPQFATPPTGYSNTTGQSVSDSQDASASSQCPVPTCTSESSMLNSAAVTATASAGTGANYVIDNDVTAANYWQTNGADNHITMDYGQNYVLNGFTYYPSTNGNTVLAYTIQTSTDNINFTTVTSGSFPSYNTTTHLQVKGTPTTVRFTTPVNARYLRMIVAASGKRVAEIVPLVCGLTPIDVTCDTVPLVSTGTNATATSKKAVRNLDNNWTVTHFAGGTANPITSTFNYNSITNALFHPAIVVGKAINTPPFVWATSPYGNAEWISATQNAMDINSQGLITGADNTLPNTYFYKYKFNISDPLLVASLKLRLDYYVDNQIVRVYVNGVDQGINSTDPQGYADGHGRSTLLDKDFQLGTNELIVQMYSQPGFAGLLVQGIPTCYCLKDPNSTSPGIDSKHGITLLKRAGAENGNWPMVRKSAHTVLESNTKGFVPTRMTTAALANITAPQEGMMVFDTTEQCLKIYDGIAWKCFITPACP